MKGKRMSTSKQPPKDSGPIRLNRFIARAGVCARRKADELIVAGRVSVNGVKVTALGTRVGEGDLVKVNGREISTQAFTYILLNKPRNTISTVSDDRGRNSVIDLITRIELRPGLFPVGRLDRDTTGALLLTTDGDLANRLMHPKWEVKKIYVARTKRDVTPDDVARLLAGVELDDGPARADEALHADPSDSTKVALQIHEGRNRQIRRMFEAIGHEIVQLDRIQFAGLTLNGLKRGRWRLLKPHEVKRIRKVVRL